MNSQGEVNTAARGGASTGRPFFRIDCAAIRSGLRFLTGGETQVWLVYLSHSNHEGIAWPSLSLIATETGLSASRAGKLRNSLIRKAWLIPAGSARGGHGTFGVPRFRPVIPQIHHAAKTAHGESTTRQKSNSPHGENDSHRTAKTTHEVEVREVDSKEASEKPANQPALVVLNSQKNDLPSAELEAFNEAQRRFRITTGRSLGSLGKRADEWSRLLDTRGKALVVGAIDIWARENREFLMTLNYPLAHFLKHSGELCDAAQVVGEQKTRSADDSNDGLTDYERNFRDCAPKKFEEYMLKRSAGKRERTVVAAG